MRTAERIARDRVARRAQTENRVARTLRTIASQIRIAVGRAIAQGRKPGDVVGPHFERLEAITVDAAVESQLAGMLDARGMTEKARRFKTLARAQSITSVIEFTRRRLDMTPEAVEALRATYLPRGTKAVTDARVAVERAIREGLEEIAESGIHVRGGMRIMREKLDGVIPPQAPHVFETMVRTEMSLAYTGGQMLFNAKPEIQEILWGYEYVTVGDDRVRPTHAGLDGVKLPKDDPRWSEITPPNGYNCRCSLIEVFFDGDVQEPPSVSTFEFKDGRTIDVVPGPDPGFAFNPLDLVGV